MKGKKRLRRINASSQFNGRVIAMAAPVELVAAAGEGSKLATFDMVAYTGGLMNVGFGAMVVVDLDGVKAGAMNQPIFRDHSAGRIVGHTTSVEITGSEIRLAGVVSGTGADAREVVDNAKNGFPWQASIGAMPERVEFVKAGATGKANSRTFAGPCYIVRASRLVEVSFVALGADSATSARVAAKRGNTPEELIGMNFEAWLAQCGIVAANLNATQLAALRATFDAAQDAETEDPEDPEAPAPVSGSANPPRRTAPPSQSQQTIDRLRAEAVAETDRINTIRNLCAGGNADIEAMAIAGGWDVERTELQILRANRVNASSVRVPRSDIPDEAHEVAMCRAANISEETIRRDYSEAAIRAAARPEFSGYSIHSLCAEVRRRAGVTAHYGAMTDDLIRATLQAERRLQATGAITASGGFSTLSMSGVLSNVANKTLRESFEAVESVVGDICAQSDVNDFKDQTAYRMTVTAGFEELGPNGELKHAELDEDSYTNRLETYGTMLSLTREMMINDDLGAFLKIPRQLGQRAAARRERLVMKLLVSNAGNFFHTNNGNTISGSTSALSIDGLTLAEKLFYERKDKTGEPILARPKVLLVSPAKKVAAETISASGLVVTGATTLTPNVNPHAGKFKVVMSPYLAEGVALHANSDDDRWYLFADPRNIAAISVIYLRGRRTPTIESSEMAFNVLGMQWRAYWDLGVAFDENRGAVMCEGD